MKTTATNWHHYLSIHSFLHWRHVSEPLFFPPGQTSREPCLFGNNSIRSLTGCRPIPFFSSAKTVLTVSCGRVFDNSKLIIITYRETRGEIKTCSHLGAGWQVLIYLVQILNERIFEQRLLLAENRERRDKCLVIRSNRKLSGERVEHFCNCGEQFAIILISCLQSF